MTSRMTIDDQLHDIVVKIWIRFITIISDVSTMLLRQGPTNLPEVNICLRSITISTITFKSALDFEHVQKPPDRLTQCDDLWRLTETSQELPRLVVQQVSTLYTTDQDLQVIGVVSGRMWQCDLFLRKSLAIIWGCVLVSCQIFTYPLNYFWWHGE